jgi:hypothetical protein
MDCRKNKKNEYESSHAKYLSLRSPVVGMTTVTRLPRELVPAPLFIWASLQAGD